MPNWSYNRLEVSGPAEEVKRFRDNTEPFAPWNLHPIPDELEDILIEDVWADSQKAKRWRKLGGKDVPMSKSEEDRLFLIYGARSWYEWILKEWGFDGRFILHETRETKDGLVYLFDTAVIPPLRLILHISRSFPVLSFGMTFFDPFRGYMGEICALGGKETKFEYEEPEWDDPRHPYNQICGGVKPENSDSPL